MRFYSHVFQNVSSITFAVLTAVSQLYNMFPRLVSWVKNRKLILENFETTIRDTKVLVKQLKETLNPDISRGFVDCFLIRKQKEEVRLSVFCCLIGNINNNVARLSCFISMCFFFLSGFLC